MGKHAFLPLPTRQQLVAVYPALLKKVSISDEASFVFLRATVKVEFDAYKVKRRFPISI